jgi:hypothetical protein
MWKLRQIVRGWKKMIALVNVPVHYFMSLLCNIRTSFHWVKVNSILLTKFMNTFVVRHLSYDRILNKRHTIVSWFDTNTKDAHNWLVTRTGVLWLMEVSCTLIMKVAVLWQALFMLSMWVCACSPLTIWASALTKCCTSQLNPCVYDVSQLFNVWYQTVNQSVPGTSKGNVLN